MDLSDLLSTMFARRYSRRMLLQSDSRPLSALADDLLGTTGEISGLAIAEDIPSRFEIMGDA